VNGTSEAFTVVSDTEITFPTGDTGPVTVTTPGGTASASIAPATTCTGAPGGGQTGI
jgi:hypothetical protein